MTIMFAIRLQYCHVVSIADDDILRWFFFLLLLLLYNVEIVFAWNCLICCKWSKNMKALITTCYGFGICGENISHMKLKEFHPSIHPSIFHEKTENERKTKSSRDLFEIYILYSRSHHFRCATAWQKMIH